METAQGFVVRYRRETRTDLWGTPDVTALVQQEKTLILILGENWKN